jgi:hypothetical protein
MKTSKTAKQVKAGQDLIEVFGLRHMNPIDLYRQAKAIENKLNVLFIAFSSDTTGVWDCEKVDACSDLLRSKIEKLLTIPGDTKPRYPITINRDPRGYSLKIDSSIAKGLNICHDFDGNGIIAPEF